MSKKRIKIMTILCLLLSTKNVYASNVTISANSKVTKGNEVTVTVKVNADSGIYTLGGTATCSGAGASGGTDLHYEDLNTSATSKSFSFKIKPTSAGTVTCTTSNVTIRELSKETEYSLANAGATITVSEPVAVTPKEYSSDNTLKDLKIEGQSLTPTFNKDTTEYKLSLDETIEKVTVNASPNSDKATVTGTGEKTLSNGENTIEIKVTAENGNEKIYKIIITVEDKNPITVKIGKNNYTVVKKNNNLIDKLDNYEETTIKINNQDVIAYKNSKTKVLLVILKDKNNKLSYYTYNEQTKEYQKYTTITVGNITLQLLDLKDKPEKYLKTTTTIQEQKVTIYKIKKSNKIGLIYGTNIKTGNTGLYVYDPVEETLSRYYNPEVKLYKEELKNLKEYIMIGIAIISLFSIVLIILSLKKGKKKKVHKITM